MFLGSQRPIAVVVAVPPSDEASDRSGEAARYGGKFVEVAEPWLGPRPWSAYLWCRLWLTGLPD